MRIDDFPDFLILDLLGSSLVFGLMEKLFGLRKEQPIGRLII